MELRLSKVEKLKSLNNGVEPKLSIPPLLIKFKCSRSIIRSKKVKYECLW